MPFPDLNIEFDNILLEEQQSHIERQIKEPLLGRYSPSDIPYCLRRQYYDFYLPRPIPPANLRIMEAGNMTHEWIAKMLQRMTKRNMFHGEIQTLESEKPFIIAVDTNDDIAIHGRYDNFLILNQLNTSERYLIEVKSQKSLYYTTDYKKEHSIQIMPYMYMQKPCKGIFIYIDRASYDMKIFPTPPLDYDPKIMSLIFSRTKLLDGYIKSQTLPPAEAKQSKDTIYQCSYCPWKIECDAADAMANKWVKKP